MARRVFHSFRYKYDNWRVQQVKQMGVLEGQPLLSSNEWEKIKGAGDAEVKKWIDKQMSGKSCLVVLIGTATAGRKLVEYEIEKAWNDKRGVVGLYIHNLKDLDGNQASKGRNPFDNFTVGLSKKRMSSVVKAYDPPFVSSTYVYNHIKDNLASWVEQAIEIRNNFSG
jgi:hypothetical protein